LLPLAINIGMTPEQFWYDDPDLFWNYWDAYEIKKEEEAREQNAYAYNLSYYIYLAIRECVGLCKKKIFPDKPFELSFDKKDKKEMTNEEYQDIRKVQMMQIVQAFNSGKK
jgi:hypothetical protein